MTSATFKRNFTKKFSLFLSLICFLWFLLPLSVVAQPESGTTNNEEEVLIISVDRFRNIGENKSDEAIILEKNGHIMLQTDLSEVTEGLEIKLMAVFNVEDLDKLFKQLNEAGKMPSKFEESHETKLLLAKYIILPKFFCLGDNIRVDASLCPVKEGATSISCSVFFNKGEINSGIRNLADNIVEKIFKNEGIDYTPENKRYPRVGFRDFKNMTEEEKYNHFRLLIPVLINSSLSQEETSRFQLIKPIIEENDFDLSDNEIASQNSLDVLISGYFLEVGDNMHISCDVMYSSGTMITNKITKIRKDEDIVGQINKLADEIKKVLDGKL